MGELFPDELKTPRSVEELAIELAELDPKPVTNFTPDNLDQVLSDFLEGRVRNPDHATYSKLDSLDLQARADQYSQVLEEIKAHPEIPNKHHRVYDAYVVRSLDINELMQQAVAFRTAISAQDRDLARQRLQELNDKLYGSPEVPTAAAMVQEVLNETQDIDNSKLQTIRDEFIALLPEDLKSSDAEASKLRPSQQAQALVQRTVEAIYEPLLRHVDPLVDLVKAEEGKDKVKIDAQGIAVVFQSIIDNEFPDSGWKVEITDANAINVDATTKTVKVPIERKPVTVDKLKGLVVHELGVHMLRSIIGEKSDMIPLRFGLAGYRDADEGMGTVMESALTDNASRTGYQHYLTATLLGSGKDFRDTFEVMWRYKVLDAYLDKPRESIDDEFIEKQKTAAAKFMLRSVRGTNGLPWHVTLNYFTGSHKIWKYIEKYADDRDLIILMFMGKIDPANEQHLRDALDAKGRV